MECVKEPPGSLLLHYLLLPLTLSLIGTQMASSMVLHQSSNHDELFMKQSLQFSDTLKDLKNLRKQLYSAAEYFETSYGKEEDKETLIDTLKEYAAKALVNTVDHLGSVSDKFNSFLSDNSTHFSTTRLLLSSLEQRVRLCKEFVEKSGTHQHCFLFQHTRHHKRYFFPRITEQGRGTSFSAGDDSDRFKSAIRSAIKENHPHTANKKIGSFTFLTSLHNNTIISNTTSSKRTNSPMRFPLLRSGSLSKRSNSPSQQRIMALAETQRTKGAEIVEVKQSSSRIGKKNMMLKALMSMSKSRN